MALRKNLVVTTLSTHTQRLIAKVYRTGAPRFADLTVMQARKSFQTLHHHFGFEPVAMASVQDIPLSRSNGPTLLSRLYTPLMSERRAHAPLVVYFHGGGWCVGDIESYDGLCRRLASVSGCPVLSIDYRLAPESPFPAATEDALFACSHALINEGTLPSANGLILAGDSAGGTLATVTALHWRDAGKRGIKELWLIYPCTDLISVRPSRQLFADGYMLDRSTLQWFFTNYLGDEIDADSASGDWRLSPIRASSLAGLPPIRMVTADHDPLTDDCEAFCSRVARENGSVDCWRAAGVVHGFFSLGRIFPEAEEALAFLAASVV